MRKYAAKHIIRITGKMNPINSAHIAQIYARAALTFSRCIGLAALIAAIRWW